MARYSDPETFEERKKAVASVLADLAKWPHSQNSDMRVRDFDREMESAARDGKIPKERVVVRPDYTDDDEPRAYDSYTWQIFAITFPTVMFMSEEEVREWTEERRNAKNNQTTTDASNQWRAANRAKILLGEWLLGEVDEE